MLEFMEDEAMNSSSAIGNLCRQKRDSDEWTVTMIQLTLNLMKDNFSWQVDICITNTYTNLTNIQAEFILN